MTSTQIDKEYLENVLAGSLEYDPNNINHRCARFVSLLIPQALNRERSITLSGNDSLFIENNLEYVTDYLNERDLVLSSSVVKPFPNGRKPGLPNPQSTFYHISF